MPWNHEVLAEQTLEIAATRDLLVGIVPFVLGLAAVALLVAAVWKGITFSRRRPPPPRPQDQPQPPASGPVGEIQEHRQSKVVPRSSERLRPHNLSTSGTEPADTPDTPDTPAAPDEPRGDQDDERT